MSVFLCVAVFVFSFSVQLFDFSFRVIRTRQCENVRIFLFRFCFRCSLFFLPGFFGKVFTFPVSSSAFFFFRGLSRLRLEGNEKYPVRRIGVRNSAEERPN